MIKEEGYRSWVAHFFVANMFSISESIKTGLKEKRFINGRRDNFGDKISSVKS